MKKYLIPLIAAAVLLCTMLCACGQGDEADTMPTVTTSAASTSAESSAEPFSSQAGDVGDNDTSDGVINENNSGSAGASDTTVGDATTREAD